MTVMTVSSIKYSYIAHHCQSAIHVL